MSSEVVVLCVAAFLVLIVVWILRAAVRTGAEPPRVRGDDTVKQMAMWSAMNADGSGGMSYGDVMHHQSDVNHGQHHGVQDSTPQDTTHGADHGGHSGGHDGGTSGDCGGGCGGDGGGGGSSGG